ncbi:LpqB family beta-propeller domain-containing protein [Amycolatopsis benzoatilytica]|uniref:LpqB family beta-propeller domain-containing protein n=1 Tax=Amycolatopsis benzoatilytica TaxID=346045 RepID=UPI0003AA2520|nr:LpqB family beta-propeller domain-containing protein [Amycolatopsis benzoatilytica]
MRRVLLLLACMLLLASCANVPQESQPVVVPVEKAPQQVNDAAEPPPNADPLDIVRLFIKANADPWSGNAASRAFFDDKQRGAWKANRSITIIDKTFSTVYDTTPTPPTSTSTAPPDPNERTVSMRGSMLGKISSDSTFIPGSGSVEQTFQVRKQADGAWRISSPPPPVLYVTDDEFDGNYNRVAVSFYSPDSGTFVPDLRYVPAKPQSGLPGRVMDMILQGPSAGLAGAVKNLFGDGVSLESNVTNNDDGSLTVQLSGLTGASPETRTLIAAQIVLSMTAVTSTRIRLLADGAPLVRDHEYWRSSDLPSYSTASSPSLDLLGMMTKGGRVLSLGDGNGIPGPAGNGGLPVVSAAQSIDGKRLAVVAQDGDRVSLHIGDLGRDLPAVDLSGGTLSRPTWRPSAVGSTSNEVWTVVDHSIIARMALDQKGNWQRQSVNANDLLALGPIGVLRLSRDGARVAATVNGQLVVASVVRSGGTVTLREPRVLQPGVLADVSDVDWGATAETLVVVTSSPSQPVERLTVDGRQMNAYNSSNLTAPVRAVAAAPNRPIVVADAGGLWNATELGEVWRPQPHTQADADPFYPG